MSDSQALQLTCPECHEKVNVDAEKALASRLKVGTLPFLIIYKDGEVVNTVTGVQTKARLLSALEG